MKRLFIGLTAIDLATIFVPVSAYATGGLVFEVSGNLVLADGGMRRKS